MSGRKNIHIFPPPLITFQLHSLIYSTISIAILEMLIIVNSSFS